MVTPLYSTFSPGRVNSQFPPPSAARSRMTDPECKPVSGPAPEPAPEPEPKPTPKPVAETKPKGPKNVGTEAFAKSRMPRPGNALLAKLAGIITHVEVLVTPGLNAFNKDHIRSRLNDSEVQEWIKEMHKLDMIPDNARKPRKKDDALPKNKGK